MNGLHLTRQIHLPKHFCDETYHRGVQVMEVLLYLCWEVHLSLSLDHYVHVDRLFVFCDVIVLKEILYTVVLSMLCVYVCLGTGRCQGWGIFERVCLAYGVQSKTCQDWDITEEERAGRYGVHHFSLIYLCVISRFRYFKSTLNQPMCLILLLLFLTRLMRWELPFIKCYQICKYQT